MKTSREQWIALREGMPCLMGCGKPAKQIHHIIPVHILRREAKAKGYSFTSVRYDIRNGQPLCHSCHLLHHNYAEGKRIQRSMLPDSVFEFAEEYDLMPFLDNEYPHEASP